jgi:hypothetical protein
MTVEARKLYSPRSIVVSAICVRTWGRIEALYEVFSGGTADGDRPLDRLWLYF